MSPCQAVLVSNLLPLALAALILLAGCASPGVPVQNEIALPTAPPINVPLAPPPIIAPAVPPPIRFGCPSSPAPDPSTPPCFGMASIKGRSALLIDQALVVPNQQGTIILAGTELPTTLYSGFPSTSPPGQDSYRIGLVASTNQGATWTHRWLAWSDLHEDAVHAFNATFLVHAAVSDSGRLHVMGFHYSFAPGGVVFYPCEPLCQGQFFLTSSDDLGQTWSAPRVLADLYGSGAYLVAQGTRLAAGWNDGTSFIHSETEDDGATWRDIELPDFPSVCKGSMPASTFFLESRLQFLCVNDDGLQFSRLMENGSLQALPTPWTDSLNCIQYEAGALDALHAFILPIDCEAGGGAIAWGPADGSSWTVRKAWSQDLPSPGWPGPTVSDGAGTLFLQIDGPMPPDPLDAVYGPGSWSNALVAYRPSEDVILRAEPLSHVTAASDPGCLASSARRFGTGVLQGEGWGMSSHLGIHYENDCLNGTYGLLFTTISREP